MVVGAGEGGPRKALSPALAVGPRSEIGTSCSRDLFR